jgi:hypothetical protein
MEIVADQIWYFLKESWGWRNITEGDEINISSSFNPQRYAVDYLPINFGGFISDLEQGPDESTLLCNKRDLP